MNRILVLMTVLLALMWGNEAVEACRCRPPPPPKESLKQAGAVFAGKVVDIKYDDGKSRMTVTIEVAATWKGDVGKTVEVQTATSSAACGYNFQKGNSYLVYCLKSPDKKDGKQPPLRTNICTRTRPMSQANDDLKDLGKGVKPQEK